MQVHLIEANMICYSDQAWILRVLHHLTLPTRKTLPLTIPSPQSLILTNFYRITSQAFCVVNVVQLIDTVCDAIIVPWGTSPLYIPLSIVWHWFLSGTFSMKLSDRYLITNTSPGYELVPYSDLSSLWFKWLFLILIKLIWIDFFVLLFVLVLFSFPFAARLAGQVVILKELDK